MSSHQESVRLRNRNDWEREHSHVVKIVDAVLEMIRQNSELSSRTQWEWHHASRIPIYVTGQKFVDCAPPHAPRKSGCERTYLHVYPLGMSSEWTQNWATRLKSEGMGNWQLRTKRLCISLAKPSNLDAHRQTLEELLGDLLTNSHALRR